MRDLFERFDRLDTRLNQWLVTYRIPLLRIALGGIFLAFGLLKFFPGLSPIEDLASRTTEALSFGLVSGRGAMVVIATLECLIGLSFVTGRFLRVGVWLLAGQMLGAMSPLVLFPHLAMTCWPFATLRDRFRATVRRIKGIVNRKSFLCPCSHFSHRLPRSSLMPSPSRTTG